MKIDNGKYDATIIRCGYVKITRYGEEWFTIEQGSNPVAFMLQELEDARVLIAKLVGDRHVNDLVQAHIEEWPDNTPWNLKRS